MLTKDQLETIKHDIGMFIRAGEIEYSKDKSSHAEVMAYARSMVMNHMKKAKELNGNQIYGVGTVVQSRQPKALASLDLDILPEDLKALVAKLV